MIAKMPFPSFKNPHFENEAKCKNFSFENEFLLHEDEKSFSCQWLCTELRLETEACGNSEMACWISYTGSHRTNVLLVALTTPCAGPVCLLNSLAPFQTVCER